MSALRKFISIVKLRRFWVILFAVSMSLFHLYTAGTTFLPGMQQRVIHLCFALILVILLLPGRSRTGQDDKRALNLLDVLLILIIIAISLYLYFGYEQILSFRMTNPTQLDLLVSVVGALLVIEGTRRACGWTLPIVCSVFLAYAFWGNYIPGSFQHSGLSVERLVGYIFLSTEGIFGVALNVSSTIIILFVLFGTFLQYSGGASFLLDLSQALTGRFRGGAAKSAIFASLLFGTISGSHVANVAATGSVTIPLMTRVGYKPYFAAAVVSVAGTGGMFMPPVMGATAFLIAEILQISYVNVVIAAIIPGILYYYALLAMVDLNAMKIGLKSLPQDQLPSLSTVLKNKGHLLIPLFVLIYFLIFARLTPAKAAFLSIVAIIIVSFFQKDTRMGIQELGTALEKGARSMLIVAMTCASAGIIVSIVSISGLSFRFGSILTEIAGGNVIILLILTMIVSLILGMGLPAVVCYLILAMLVAPALTRMGIEPIAAHLFVFYFGIINAITPPVALAAYTGASIAGADPNQTAFTAVRLGSAGFIVPFMFVFGPSLLLKGPVFDIVINVATAFIGIYFLAMALEGFFRERLNLLKRILLGGAALLLVYPNIWLSLCGIVITLLTIGDQILKNIPLKGFFAQRALRK